MKRTETYYIYIKSHAQAPDYEDWCEASDPIEAAQIFANRINKSSDDFWSPESLIEYIVRWAKLENPA